MSVLFDNYENFPMGDSQLNIVNNKLVVSNIGSSGLDGVMIKNDGSDSIHAYLEPIDLENGGVLRVTTIGKNSLNQLATRSETVTWLDTSTNRVQFGYNMCLIPKHFRIIGNLNGNPVFDIPKDNPFHEDPPPDPAPLGFWAALGAIAAIIEAAIEVYKLIAGTEKNKVETTINSDGTWTVKTTKETDPTQIEVEVDGQTYTVDEWGIEYTEIIPENHTDKVMNIAALQMTGYDLGNLEITSITQ